MVVSRVLYFRRLGELCRAGDDHGLTGQGGGVLMAPKSMQSVFLEECHNVCSDGQMGMNKTWERVKRSAIWHRETSELYMKSCMMCNQQKKPRVKPKAPLG